MDNYSDENSRYSCNIKKDNSNTYNFSESKCLQIGDMAPDFHANTTFGDCKLSDYKRKMASIFLSSWRSYSGMYN